MIGIDSIQVMKGRGYFEKLQKMYEKKEVKEYFEDFFRFSDINNKCVLDAGCGIGYSSKILKSKGNHVFSFDTNRKSVTYAKKSMGVEYPLVASVESIPFKDKVFDAVYFLDVLEHLPEPLSVLKDLRRVLKDEGELLLITPNGLIRKSINIIFGKDIGDKTHIKEFTYKELKELMAKAGFRIESIKVSGIVLLNKINFRFARKLGHKLNKAVLPLASPSFWVKAKKIKQAR